MEVATPRPNLAPPPDPGKEAPKLGIDRFVDGAITCLRFVGTIDESFEGKKLAATVKADALILDLGEVKKISSFGIREWVDFVGTAGKAVKQLVLIECAPKVVDQLNMVANFAGEGRVFSFYAPFRCDYCDSEHRALLQVDRDWDAIKAMKLSDRPCPSCSEAMYFDEDPTTFFSYVIGHDKFELDADLAAFLAAKLNYAVSDASRKLRVDKQIEGRATYVRMIGDLDSQFPRDKIAEGLEGQVVVDVGGVGRIEPAGAAEWRSFVQQITPLVESIHLVGVPPPFLEKLSRKDDLGEKGFVLTLTLPYACATCASTTGQTIDVEQHHDLLKFATAPELKCAQCKGALQCVAPEAIMAILPALPKPSPSAELRKAIKELKDRRPAARKSAAGTGATATGERRSGPLWVPFLAAGLAVALAAGAFIAYRAWSTKDDAGPGLGKVIAASPGGRPAWITAGDVGTASCTDEKGAIACVGISTAALSQSDAEDDAGDAALEAVAHALAAKVGDAKWQGKVPAIWSQARDAKLGAQKRDPESSAARRDVREARRAVAQALRVGAGGQVLATPGASYWEQHETSQGNRFVAYVRYVLAPADAKRLVEVYGKTETALGATVVPAFPLVAWRWPQQTQGAIVVALGAGRVKELGIAEKYMVLDVGGRDVADAAAFARIATDEVARLESTGGQLQIQVQGDDPRPKSFAQAIKAKVTEPVDDGKGKGDGKHGDGGRGTGGVNVWDKYGGGKKPSPDDPNQ
jgi:anti-anti-sigma regulatory factor/ABC-type transporter Mla MlaB component